MSTSNNGPAFPTKKVTHMVASADSSAEPVYQVVGGLTKREYFAAMAMQAIISKAPFFLENAVVGLDIVNERHTATALGAFAYADAMLAASEASNDKA